MSSFWSDSWLLVAIAFYPAMVLAVFVHETGHYLAARLMGMRVLAWGIGLSRPRLRLPLGKSIFYVGKPLHGGLTLVRPDVLRRSLPREFLFIAGGPAASIVGLAVGGAIWTWVQPSGVLLAWIAASALIVLSSCVPFRVQSGAANLASDAWLLVDNVMRLRMSRKQPAGTTLTTVLAVSDLLRRIGSTDGADCYRLIAGIVQCDLADLDGAREGVEVGRTLSATDFPEAPGLLLLIESALLVATESAHATEYLAAAQRSSTELPELQYLLECLSLRWRLARGEQILEDLNAQIAQTRGDRRRDRLCVLESLAFEADPPADAAAGCRQLIARHRAYLGDTELARLLALTTELLAARGELPASRAYFQEAQQTLLRVAQSIQPAERRTCYLREASLPLQRAALACPADVPLFLPDAPVRKTVGRSFGQATLNLGLLCLGANGLAHMAQDLRAAPLSRAVSATVMFLVAVCWFATMLTTIVSLFRSERRYLHVLAGMILATAGFVLAGQLIPTPKTRYPNTRTDYRPEAADGNPASP